MISDLKEDSRRWANERSHLEQRYGYGQGSPVRDPSKTRNPDTSLAPSYLSSNIHDERQQLGPTQQPGPIPGPMQSQPMPGQPQYGQYGSNQGGMNPQQYGTQQPSMGDNYSQFYTHTSGPPSVSYPPSSVSYSTYDNSHQTAPRTANPLTTNPYGDPANTYGGDGSDYASSVYYSTSTTSASAPQYPLAGMPQQQGYPPRDPVGYPNDPRASAANRHDTGTRDSHRDQRRRR